MALYDVSVCIKRNPRLGRWGSAIMSHAGREEREGGVEERAKKIRKEAKERWIKTE